MNDMTSKPANAQDIVDRLNPVPKRYDSLSFSVSDLNQQIAELVAQNETLDDGIEAWEQQIAHARSEIRKAKRQKERNEAQAAKLRAKRQIVSEAAFKAAAVDQP